MAGIGFELRRLFRKDSMSSKFKGMVFATFVSTGPMIVSVGMILVIGQILRNFGVSLADREVAISAIMYDYIFAMILTSGFAMTLSRYLADQFYLNRTEDILASLAGALAITSGIGCLVGTLFFLRSPLPLPIQLPAYMLFIELIVLYILMVYLSALKNYQEIAWSFVWGGGVAIGLTILTLQLGLSAIPAALSSVAIGYLLIVVKLTVAIRRRFSMQSGQMLLFSHYLTIMPKLFLTNLFYTLGIFIHNILFWHASSLKILIDRTYAIAPDYDTATFFAVLTIIPATVLFVVKVETGFYERYRSFCQTIIDGASLRDIRTAKSHLIDVTRKELTFIFEVQFIITLLAIIFGVNVILPALGNSKMTMDLFVILAMGYFLTFMAFIVTTLILYFDNQDDALKTTAIFLFFSASMTALTLWLGELYYGLGLAASALITLLVSLYYLTRTIEKIDYRMFSLQPYANLVHSDNEGSLHQS